MRAKLAVNTGDTMPEFEKAEYGIPHCDSFERTSDGFKVSFKTESSNPVGIASAVVVLFIVGLSLAFAVGIQTNAMLGVIIFGADVWLMYWVARKKRTSIEVTKDAVIIDEKMLRRSDFGGFHVRDKNTISIKGNSFNMSTLGYNYGATSFPSGVGQVVEKQ